MPYDIVRIAPVPADRRLTTNVSKFPFDNLDLPGQGFYVPNLDNMPASAKQEEASTLRNMQTHCAIRNRRKKNIVKGATFKAALYPPDPRWIQVWRES